MGPVKNEEVKEQFEFCRDIWNFYKTFYNIDNTDNYWFQLNEAARVIGTKYQGRTYRKILYAVLDDFDSRMTERRQEDIGGTMGG